MGLDQRFSSKIAGRESLRAWQLFAIGCWLCQVHWQVCDHASMNYFPKKSVFKSLKFLEKVFVRAQLDLPQTVPRNIRVYIRSWSHADFIGATRKPLSDSTTNTDYDTLTITYYTNTNSSIHTNMHKHLIRYNIVNFSHPNKIDHVRDRDRDGQCMSSKRLSSHHKRWH